MRLLQALLSSWTASFQSTSALSSWPKVEGECLVQVLSSYLDSRSGFVLVEGCMSDEIVLQDMIFQGTVLGPILWNLFFAGVLHVLGLGILGIPLDATAQADGDGAQQGVGGASLCALHEHAPTPG